jgi:hypothetical protein
VSDDRPPPQALKLGFREILTDALRFWEWRRMFYNLALAAVVLLKFAYFWPASRIVLKFEAMLGMFLLVVLANVAYCAAYLVEVLVQFSEFREPWRKRRMVLWIVGTAFAGVLAHFFTDGIFGRDWLPNQQ